MRKKVTGLGILITAILGLGACDQHLAQAPHVMHVKVIRDDLDRPTEVYSYYFADAKVEIIHGERIRWNYRMRNGSKSEKQGETVETETFRDGKSVSVLSKSTLYSY